MYRYIKISLFCLIIGAVSWSCTPEQDAANRALTYLPADSDGVLIIKTGKLLDKANWAGIQASAPFEDFLEDVAEDEPAVAKILRDPSASGLDTEANTFFAGVAPFLERGNLRVVLAFPVADAEKLAATMREMDEQTAQAVDDRTWKNGRVSLAWNDEIFLMVQDNSEGNSASVLLEADGNGLADNRDLRDFVNEDFDMGWWATGAVLAERLPDEMLDLLPGLTRDDLKGNYLHGSWRFEAGKMVGEMRPVLSRKLAADIDLMFRSETDADLSEGLPTDGLAGLFTVAYDMAGLDQLLLEHLVEGGARETLKERGIEYETLVNTLSGDLLMGLYDSEIFPEALLVMGLNDAQGFEEMIGKASKFATPVGDGLFQLKEVNTSTDEEGNTQVDSSGGAWLRVMQDRFVLSDARAAVEGYGAASNEVEIIQRFRELRPNRRFAAVWSPDQLMDDDIPAELFDHAFAYADDEMIVNHWIMEDASKNSLEVLMRLLPREMVERDTTTSM